MLDVGREPLSGRRRRFNMSNMKVRTGAAVCAATAVTTLVGCTGGSSSVRSTPLRADATGVIAGFVDLCTGPAAMPPRAAWVRVMAGRATVTSARVMAGEPAHQSYRVPVRPGRYRVEASNWPHVRRTVNVEASSLVTANFPNLCG